MSTAAARTGQAGERRVAFVRLPEAPDVTSGRNVVDALVAARAGRPGFLIADGARTGFCGGAGVSALVCAQRRAAAAGAQLRPVMPGLPVRRAVKLTAAHDVPCTYSSMAGAVADMTGPQAGDSPGVPAGLARGESAG